MKELVRHISDLTAEDFTLLEQAMADNHPQVYLQFSIENAMSAQLDMLLKQLRNDVHTSASDSGVHSESEDSVCGTRGGGEGQLGENILLQQLISPTDNTIIPAISISSSRTDISEAEVKSDDVCTFDAGPLVQGVHMYRNGVIISVGETEDSPTGEMIQQQSEAWTPCHNEKEMGTHKFNYCEAVAFLWTGDDNGYCGCRSNIIMGFLPSCSFIQSGVRPANSLCHVDKICSSQPHHSTQTTLMPKHAISAVNQTSPLQYRGSYRLQRH